MGQGVDTRGAIWPYSENVLTIRKSSSLLPHIQMHLRKTKCMAKMSMKLST